MFLLALVLCSCSAEQIPAALETAAPKSPVPASATASAEAPTASMISEFFIATDQVGAFTPPPSVARARLVKINRSLLLDEQGQALHLPPNAEVRLNLFPDVSFTGVIERMEQDGDGYSWVGHLKNVETSELFIVYTAGVFIGHFASPSGVYEVSSTGDDLYRIIMVDQSKLHGQGGEEPNDVNPTSTPG
jgi:hypothetical protein